MLKNLVRGDFAMSKPSEIVDQFGGQSALCPIAQNVKAPSAIGMSMESQQNGRTINGPCPRARDKFAAK